MHKLIAVFFILGLSGCTNYLYQGDFTARNHLGEVSNFKLWWSETDPIIGKSKAGPMTLDVACGTAIQFTENESGIEFIAATDRYKPVTNVDNTKPLVCGKITNLDKLLDYQNHSITLAAYCVPIEDDEGFSAVKPIFLSTTPKEYSIPIKIEKKRSVLGKSLEAEKLSCP